jgi:hypothetical protein
MRLNARIPPHRETGRLLRTRKPSDEEGAAVELDFDGHLPWKTTFERTILPGARESLRGIGVKPRSVQPMGPKKKSFTCGSTAKRIRSSSPE